MITLYARLSTINMGRQISYLTVESNIINIQKDKAINFKKYYKIIKENQSDIDGYIPESIFWTVINLSNIIYSKISENESNMNELK
jgi:hypothetical protein